MIRINEPDAMIKSRTKEMDLGRCEFEDSIYDYEQLIRIIENRNVSVCISEKTKASNGRYIIRGVKTIGSVPRAYKVENLTEEQVGDIERLLEAQLK